MFQIRRIRIVLTDQDPKLFRASRSEFSCNTKFQFKIRLINNFENEQKLTCESFIFQTVNLKSKIEKLALFFVVDVELN